MAKLFKYGSIAVLALLAVILFWTFVFPPGDPNPPTPASASTDDWPTYMFDGARSGFNKNEVRLSPDNAANLKLLWKQHLGNVLAAQPIVKGDTVYEGSWDGF